MTSLGKRYLSTAILAVLALGPSAVAQEASLAPFSFTAAQAAGGRANYAAKCARCHGSELEGGSGPALANGALDNYLTGSVGALFDFINASMPQDMPGTLSPDETTTLIAYLASRNGRTPGGAPIPGDASAMAKMGFNQ